GKRKGPRFDEKELWVARIRALRKFLRKLKSRRKISPKTYRRLYRLAKGGYFRSVSHLKAYIEEHKLMER
ncbi:MAG TPA: 50S ribosomal protein L19e, partial [Thermoprotei archaeon]|nr:50S ribosomal protein L19e [Thermoprotei archaeon]